MITLPATATAASQLRYRWIHELVANCPPTLGQEIALTGSASRGIADDDSDIELNFWMESIPPATERAAWLHTAGATDIALDTVTLPGESVWGTFHIHGVLVEAGWQTVASLQEALRALLAGEVIAHFPLLLGEVVAHAVPVRTAGLLAIWQEDLARYPDVLRERLIADACDRWIVPHLFSSRWALSRRGEGFALADQLIWDIKSILRLLFALNRQWEPEWKWLDYFARSLAIKPERLVERIDEIVSAPHLEQRAIACTELIIEALTLAPPFPNVTQALAVAQGSLHQQR